MLFCTNLLPTPRNFIRHLLHQPSLPYVAAVQWFSGLYGRFGTILGADIHRSAKRDRIAMPSTVQHVGATGAIFLNEILTDSGTRIELRS
jgi:hypothetical protein